MHGVVVPHPRRCGRVSQRVIRPGQRRNAPGAGRGEEVCRRGARRNPRNIDDAVCVDDAPRCNVEDDGARPLRAGHGNELARTVTSNGADISREALRHSERERDSLRAALALMSVDERLRAHRTVRNLRTDDHGSIVRNIEMAQRQRTCGAEIVALDEVAMAEIDIGERCLDAVGIEDAPPAAEVGMLDQTVRDLRSAGFVDSKVWTHADPADFETRESFEEYLQTVCLGPHLERIDPPQRNEFVRAVADKLPDRRIDYVRLNATASLS